MQQSCTVCVGTYKAQRKKYYVRVRIFLGILFVIGFALALYDTDRTAPGAFIVSALSKPHAAMIHPAVQPNAAQERFIEWHV